ncbi:MAG: GTP-binding protein [Lachnospiraceae bacterium]|nr:GTP-binding protein [Lachnospiraceae bacterium]
MIKIDLITGFLGAGKTTFLKKYADFLIRKGMNIGILENDYGAVNVDMMLLQDLMGDHCELEMVAGGCHRDCHRRRFQSKLIAMGMCGYDRVLVEPSGIYDVDEFFDVLHEDPLEQWYEIGNVIAIVDAKLEEDLSEEAEYLLASEVADAGCVVMSKSQDASETEIAETIRHLNRALGAARCSRRFGFEVMEMAKCDRLSGSEAMDTAQCGCQLGSDVITGDWNLFTESDFERILSCGYRNESFQKRSAEDELFSSVYFMNVRMSEEELRLAVGRIFMDEACGNVFRIKGFLRVPGEADAREDTWMQLNATRSEITLSPIQTGQEVLIVIGENLNEEAIQVQLG